MLLINFVVDYSYLSSHIFYNISRRITVRTYFDVKSSFMFSCFVQIVGTHHFLLINEKHFHIVYYIRRRKA